MSTDDQEKRTVDETSTHTNNGENQSQLANLGVNTQLIRSRSQIEDPSDPYFLHHGDNRGNILVSQLLTGQDNYVAWSHAIELAISVKNKLGFLNGSIPKPPISNHVLYNAWIRNNNIVISWIINSVSKEISSSILYDESASAIWNDLKVRFQQRNGAHIYNLRKGLMNLKQENQTVSMYFTRLKTVWEQLTNFRPSCTCNGCTCGGVKKLQDHYNMEYIMSFLMGLSDFFAQVREINTVLPQSTPTQYQQLLGLLAAQTCNQQPTDPGPSSGKSVDDHSRFTWVYLLKQKSDVLSIIPDFISYLQTQYNCIFKRFRSNNAPELAFKELFAKHGILHDFTCIETPEQNVVAERKHQHLLNVARALFFQSKVPIEYWTECLLTAVFLINRSPTPNLQKRTPYEILFGKPPDYSDLKCFGCLAFASTITSHRTKFEPRARTCVFLGYPRGIKGYKLLNTNPHIIDPFTTTVLPHSEITHTHITDYPAEDTCVISPNPCLQDTFDNTSSTADADAPGAQNQQENIAEQPATQHQQPSTSPTAAAPRRSTRVSKPPSYLQDFECYNLLQDKSNTSYPISKFLSYSKLSKTYKAFILAVTTEFEPQNYKQAIQFKRWLQAMDTELLALITNKTWTVVPLPTDKRAIGCRWVYKIKYNSDGSVERLKARLVAQGYTQQEGLDFFDTFSPVAKMVTFKLLLAIVTIKQWHTLQLDINNAFLNGDLEEEPVPTYTYFMLYKTHYSPDFASKLWVLLSIFSALRLLEPKQAFFLSQRKYTLQLLHDTGYTSSKPAKAPMDPRQRFDDVEGEVLDNSSQYRQVIGRLLYLTLSRPDITFAVNTLSQFMSRPRTTHLIALHHLLRYLKGSPGQDIFYSTASSLHLRGFSDSDWATCPTTRRSITGFYIFIGDCLISWKTKKQATVSKSSAEAEYRVLASTTSEMTWIQYLLTDLHIAQPTPAFIYCDNQSAIHIANNPTFHERTKHIELDCHFIREKIAKSTIYIFNSI
uniref:Integrase catalytic domain-containing protein n=1 Tax=Cannabis sativa TaxID=3483 RepID=A0A803P3R9_CANSA